MTCDEDIDYEPWYKKYVEALSCKDMEQKIKKLYEVISFNKISSSKPFVLLANLSKNDYERLELYIKAFYIDGNRRWCLSLLNVLVKLRQYEFAYDLSKKIGINLKLDSKKNLKIDTKINEKIENYILNFYETKEKKIIKKRFHVFKKNFHKVKFCVLDGKLLLERNYKSNIYDFVINQNKELIIGCKHNFLCECDAWVYSTGRLKLDSCGNILEIDNWSGHFCPTAEEFNDSLALFKELNININNCKKNVMNFNYSEFVSDFYTL